MRSRAERRRAIERAWRALALLFLAWAIVAAFRRPSAAAVALRGEALASELPRLTRASRAPALALALEAAPAAGERDWLRALARAGARITWRASTPFAPLALEVIPRADPAGGVRALVAGAPGAHVMLGDGAGPLDTLDLATGAAALRLPLFVPPLAARAGAQRARAEAADSLALRRIAVLGAADWEGKFLAAALEERGWAVSAAFTVAPGLAVTQGAPLALDTARFAAVIVLDSATAAREGRALADFARRGGGVVLAGRAAAAPALAPIRPGGAGARERPAALAFSDSAPRRALGFASIAPLARESIPLESRDGRVAVAARRVGAGRVLQVGYDESWRWRFGGGAHAPEAERAWWSELVAGVAARGAHPRAAPANADAAPLAQWVAALGAADTAAAALAIAPRGLPWWLLAIILASLLAEFASRRLRGAP